jgi:curved DNA-binding protein CbpA
MSEAKANASLSELQIVLERIDADSDHFELLGVARGGDVEVVRQAFFRLARLIHPDLAVFDDDDKRAQATKAFQRVATAHKTLTDPATRESYLHEIGVGQNAPSKVDRNPELARIHFHRAQQLLTRKDFSGAEQGFTVAESLLGERDDDSLYVAFRGWAIYNNPNRNEVERIECAKKMWDEILEGKDVAEGEAEAAYFMALWCKTNGEVPAVKKLLERCLKLNRRHINAQRELRLFKRRRASGAFPSLDEGRKRRRSRATIPEAKMPTTPKTKKLKKVMLEKKKSWFERLFSK